MSEFTLTKTRLFEGVWEGVLTHEEDRKARPGVAVTLLGEAVDGVAVIENESAGHWVLRVPIPAHMIADGVQTFLIRDTATDTVLGSFSLIAGEALAYDIRAEVTLLREELDMLKRAFRRHCLETM